MDIVPSNTSADEAVRRSAKRTADLFGSDYLMVTPSVADGSIGLSYRRKAEYNDVKELPPALAEKQSKAAAAGRAKRPKTQAQTQAPVDGSGASMSLVKKAPGPTAGGGSDITRWSTAVEQMRDLSDVTGINIRRMASILNEEDREYIISLFIIMIPANSAKAMLSLLPLYPQHLPTGML